MKNADCSTTILRGVRRLVFEKENLLTQLDALFAETANVELKQVYQAKEALRSIFESPLSRTAAAETLTNWEASARQHQNRFLAPFLKTFKRWKGYVVNDFQGRYNNGLVEDSTTRSKLIMRRAFGYVNVDHFRRRVIIEFAGLH